MAGVGLAPREVRVAILGVGLVGAGLFGGVVPWNPFGGAYLATESNPTGGPTVGTLLLALSLFLIGVLAAITVIQRILFVQKQAKANV
jgi:hypothetical protein